MCGLLSHGTLLNQTELQCYAATTATHFGRYCPKWPLTKKEKKHEEVILGFLFLLLLKLNMVFTRSYPIWAAGELELLHTQLQTKLCDSKRITSSASNGDGFFRRPNLAPSTTWPCLEILSIYCRCISTAPYIAPTPSTLLWYWDK